MRHEAIIAVHPAVVTINGDEWGKLQAWDANGNDVALNQTAVDAKAAELTAAQATAASGPIRFPGGYGGFVQKVSFVQIRREPECPGIEDFERMLFSGLFCRIPESA